MANYKKTRRHGRSKRQKRQSLKRNNMTFRKVMRRGVKEMKGSGLKYLKRILGSKPTTRNYKELSEPFSTAATGQDPGDLPSLDGTPLSSEISKPLQSYNVLVNYMRWDSTTRDPNNNKEGTIHIYGYEIRGSQVHLDATLIIQDPAQTQNKQYDRIKFTFYTRDGNMVITPQPILWKNNNTEMVTDIQVLSPIGNEYVMTDPPSTDLLVQLETKRKNLLQKLK